MQRAALRFIALMGTLMPTDKDILYKKNMAMVLLLHVQQGTQSELKEYYYTWESPCDFRLCDTMYKHITTY